MEFTDPVYSGSTPVETCPECYCFIYTHSLILHPMWVIILSPMWVALIFKFNVICLRGHCLFNCMFPKLLIGRYTNY